MRLEPFQSYAATSQMNPFERDDDISTIAWVDEDGLPAGNLEGPNDLGGSATVVTGIIPYSFGSLGPGQLLAFLVVVQRPTEAILPGRATAIHRFPQRQDPGGQDHGR